MKILFKTNQNSKINNTTNNILDLNSFWNQFEKLEKKVKETPQKNGSWVCGKWSLSKH